MSSGATKQRQAALDGYQRVKMAAASSCGCERLVSTLLASLHALLPLDDDRPEGWVGNSLPAPAYSSRILHLKDGGD